MILALLGASVLELGVLAAGAADLATTEVALSRGYVEANPLMRNRAARIGGKAAVTALAIAGARGLEKSGHRKTAVAVRVVLIVAWGACAAHNVRTMRR